MSLSTINWGSIADWVSGIGSLSAVVTALYLANASQRVRLRGYCGHRVIVGGGMPKQDLVSINVTNIGSRSTIINNIGIRIGLFNKRYAIITASRDLYSDGVPKPLADGEQGHWGILLDDKRTWIKDLCKDFITSKLDVETMRIQIHTTNGGTTNIRPEKALRQMIDDSLGEKQGSRHSSK